ncbi:MAG: AAA-like domain-containing protein [Cyanobacteria bacterium J06621_8]
MLDRNWEQWKKLLENKVLEFKLTKCETNVFITRFKHENWRKKIEDIWQESEVASQESFMRHSTNIYNKFKPYCPELSDGSGNFPILRAKLLEEFDSLIAPPPSKLYVERSPIERECYKAILEPGALIRIKAPSNMGKTSLLNNILAYAATKNYQTVNINFLQIERNKFSSLDKFLRWFCLNISDALDNQIKINEFWDDDRGSMLSCTRYLEMLLQDIDTNLVLGLDEIDRLFNYPEISQDFFYLLRSWHEEANNIDIWEQLKLIVVYSTDNFGKLDINQSPFNVGLPIELKPFTLEQVKDFAKLYGVVLTDKELQQLIIMLGGHPYLTKQLFDYLVINSDTSITEILRLAPTDAGIYSNHLRSLLIKLRDNPELGQAFKAIINSPQPIEIDTLLAYQLERLGLIQRTPQGDRVYPSCQLYKLYFANKL